jgi:putative peptidoglycan lipid II flippase
VLGAGTTAGVIAMTLCLVPSLRNLGWRFRWRFRPTHPAVTRAARHGAGALGYAGGYQAGLVVVLVLANRIEGGVAAYQWAYTFFYVPHALFGVPIFNVLFPALAEHATRGEEEAFIDRVREGLGMLAFLLVPIAAFLAVAARPIAELTLQYGVMTGTGATLVARVMTAFAVGLPTYSAFLALTRGFYALGDTRTPAVVNALSVAVSAALGAGLFLIAPSGWKVAGLAAGHSVGFALGAALLKQSLTRRVGVETPRPARGTRRALLIGALAFGAMAFVHALMPADGKPVALADVVVTAGAGAAVYLGVMARARSSEMVRVTALLRRARP